MKSLSYLIISIILLSLPLQAQKQVQKARQEVKFSLTENSLLKHYTDSTFERVINSSDISVRRSVKEALTTIEARNLKEQHRLWFDILMRSYGDKRDNELIAQNTLLKNVSSEKPLSAEQAIEYAQTLAENGYTPENTTKLVQEKGINVIDKLFHPEFPLSLVLFSPTIILGKVIDSYNDTQSGEFETILSIVSIEQVLKGDTTIKKLSVREVFAEDARPILVNGDSHVFFLSKQPTQKEKNIPQFIRLSDIPLTVIRDKRDYTTLQRGIRQTDSICKELKVFFHSQLLK